MIWYFLKHILSKFWEFSTETLNENDLHLFISPLCPGVPGKEEGKYKKSYDHNRPEQSIQNPETLVENIGDPVDGCALGKVLGGLEQG